MEKPKDPFLGVIDTAFAVANSLIQHATNQMKDFVAEGQTAVPAQTSAGDADFDVDVMIEREGLVRQDELVVLRATIGELKAQISELEEETKKIKKKLKTLKEKS